MFSLNHTKDIKRSSDKNFAIVFSIFFLLLSIYFYAKYEYINFITLVISIFFLFFAYIYPKIFFYPNIVWYYLGVILGNIISPIIMFFIFYVVLMPTGFFLKLFRKDILNLKINTSQNTYWSIRSSNKINMKDQF